MWNGAKIKNLRQRLGWSAADLSRRLSCKTEIIYQLENNEIEIDKDVQNQLNYLELEMLDQSQKLSKSIMAESLMKDHGLSQVNIDEMEDKNG